MKKMTAAMAALGVVAGLGAAALPLASYASEATVPVTAIIDDALSITITDAVSGDALGADGVLIDGVTPNGEAKTKNVAVTVEGTGSYTLTLEDRLMDTALINEDGVRIETANKLTKGTSAWAYGVATSLSTAATTWKAVPARGSADQLLTGADNTAEITDGSATTYVSFGVVAKTGQASGRYTSDVIFTASSAD